MKPRFFLSVAVISASVFLFFFFIDSKDNEIATEISENTTSPSPGNLLSDQALPLAIESPSAPTKIKEEDFRYIQDRLTAMQARRPDMKFDPAEVAAAIERDVAWETLKDAPEGLPLTPEELMDGREFISLDGLKMETLMPGDRVRIPIKELAGEYEITVDTVEKHDYYSISWNGHIEGGDCQSYPATFTRSANLTIGGMETPEGQYQLQVNGDKGWIASAGLLFKNHVDPIDPATVMSESGSVQSQDHSAHGHE